MSDILAKIALDKRRHIDACKEKTSVNTLMARAKSASPVRGFYNSLRRAKENNQFGIITEIKKASPSKGLIREDFNPHLLATAYENGGASCLSVLTDVPYFQGSDDYLIAARTATELPVLRKDFMIDPYQVIEARAMGADCILLIMAMLDDDLARELEQVAFEYGLDVLIETHDETEMERALALKSPLIGINNRNLKTFELSLEVTFRLSSMVGNDRMLVSESGIFSHADLKDIQARTGINSFLIGEALMRQENVAEATRIMIGE
ncbi:Indole-3-glycerol phosphate synthase [hydrothermal vent metagenome]|uniref:indole-3-glycerol-phosphate synthase n=1 Tax=hydrothermal vent metagenome TaxID=652676 RepID=A0A3B1B9I4_9ZZZZ